MLSAGSATNNSSGVSGAERVLGYIGMGDGYNCSGVGLCIQ